METELGGHRRFGGGHRSHHGNRGGIGRDGLFEQPPEYPERRPAPLGRPKPIVWALVLAGVGLWSLIAWAAYAVAEPFFGWAAANAGPFASGLGAGGVGGLIGQLSAWLQSVAKPAILIVWAVGALGLLAAPMILPALIRMRGRFYH